MVKAASSMHDAIVREDRAEGRDCVLPESPEPPEPPEAPEPPDDDGEHGVARFASSYAAHRRKAFDPDDWERLFRADGQGGLFDPPLEGVTPRRVREELVEEEGV
jgi:hypothetical protein